MTTQNLSEMVSLIFGHTMLRDYIWSPLNLSINLQYILMGLIIGSVMGTITAQERTMITELVPKKQNFRIFFFQLYNESSSSSWPIDILYN